MKRMHVTASVRAVGAKVNAEVVLRAWHLRERALQLPKEAWKALFD
jgi:hypothetical protein